MKTNIKLKVTPEQSEAVQKICFANGIERDGTGKFYHLNKPFIYIYELSISCDNKESSEYFRNHENKEVDADLFIRTNGTCEEFIDIVDNSSNNKSKENMFKQYGFKVPNFDCKIAGPIESILYGAVWIQLNSTPGMEEFGWYPEQWDIIDGMAHNDSKYNLNRIKKPWYETCKFPVLVWDTFADKLEVATEYTNDTLYLLSDIRDASEVRPLSNEEIDQLKQDF